MHPILIDLGGFELHTYGILGSLAFLIVAFSVLREARSRGWSQDAVVDVIFWGALSGIAGSRLLWVLQNPADVQGLGTVVNLRVGGLVFYGAFLGLPVGAWVARRRGLPLRLLVDAFARWLPIGHGISRIGCVAAGCCYGLPTDLPWAITFHHPRSVAPHDVALHPVQLYEAAGLFLLGAVFAWLAPRRRFAGQVMLAYVLGYAVLRTITELFRGDLDRRFVLEGVFGQVLSTSQGLSILAIIGALVLWRRWSATPTEA